MTQTTTREAPKLMNYLAVPQKRGNSQRITLPVHMLKEKKWLRVDLYLVCDHDGEYVTLRPYNYDLDTNPRRKPTASLI
jgi:hypothetical protein